MTQALAWPDRSEPAADLPEAGPALPCHDADATIRTGETTPRGILIAVRG